MGMCTRVKSASLCNFHPKNFPSPLPRRRRNFVEVSGEGEGETRGSWKEGIDLRPVNEAVDDPWQLKRGKTALRLRLLTAYFKPDGLYGQGKRSYDCYREQTAYGRSLGALFDRFRRFVGWLVIFCGNGKSFFPRFLSSIFWNETKFSSRFRYT